jgi:phosphatidylglycerol:prolipoprotein diacylglycerol transferase
MYPIPFHIFGFPVSSFGLMLALGFLVGTWLASRRMAEIGIEPEFASTMLIYCMVGGVVGAKLYYAIDTAIREPGAPFLQLLSSRDGLTFYGGLIGATVAAVLGTRRLGISTLAFANCAALAASVGQAIGRIGCLLVGDDYGRPTDLPWGIAFPEGAPPTLEAVHPTQIYESAWLFAVTAVLWRRRKKSPFLFGEYMMLGGAGRFVVEIWRINPRVGGLSEAQWIAVGLVVAGALGWWQQRAKAAA